MEKLLQIYPNGMTSTQEGTLTSAIYAKYGNPYMDRSICWPDDIKRLHRAKSAVGMVTSCYVYKTMRNWYDKYYDEYLSDYLEVGGTKGDFDQLIKVQLDHLKSKSSVLVNVHTDFEGCTYNALNESEEEEHLELL